MSFNQKTKFAIIGYPVHHSLSPLMHNAAFQYFGLPCHYSKISLTPRQVPSFLKKLPHRGYKGINVTVPHKETVIPYLQKISKEAKLIGAVNTIVVQSDQLEGFNTDGEGYLLSLKREKKFSPRYKQIVVLGAGGAARGIIALLCLKGAKKIVLANRTFNRAEKLACEFKRKFPKIKIKAIPLDPPFLKKYFLETDLLINTTSAPLKGPPLPPLPLKSLPPGAIVSDIVYRPLNTSLLKEARKVGLKTHGGLGMLLYQGALAFKLWTGKKAPIAVMKKALQKALR